MITKRIIPCLNIENGQVVSKGISSYSPLELAKKYAERGADELLIYDMSAVDKEGFTNLMKEVTRSVFIPLTVGGGITSLADFERILACGGDKVSVRSGAVRYPKLIEEAAKKYGDQSVVLTTDIKRVRGKYHIFLKNEDTGLEALEWIRRCVGNGVGEVVVNSLDSFGKMKGFDLGFLAKISEDVSVPIIASGGAGSEEHFVELFQKIPTIDAAIASTAFHSSRIEIDSLKTNLFHHGIHVRRRL